MALEDPGFVAVLAEYNERLAREDPIVHDPQALQAADVNDLLIPVGEDVGRLMHALVVGLGAHIIVELGTSYGYSTLFLADAAKATGGQQTGLCSRPTAARMLERLCRVQIG
jgi:predicted O-methyltransferase YrrM